MTANILWNTGLVKKKQKAKEIPWFHSITRPCLIDNDHFIIVISFYMGFDLVQHNTAALNKMSLVKNTLITSQLEKLKC